MKIAADFNKREIVHSTNMPWVDSPMAGVSRRPLDRVGAEVARATSVVRYAPGSHFSPHLHAGGAELFVLQGSVTEQQDTLLQHSWLRAPIGYPLSLKTAELGAKIWIKTGHLTDVEQQIQRATHSMANANG
jgi:anti-sigma factor ChrR (cupin superfamily)